MKPVTLLYGLLLCCLQTTFAQVHPGNLAIDEQSDIDSFAYTSIDGDLIIQEKSAGAIVDLHELLTLTSINGNLIIISNETLSNLDGLSNLSNIGFGSITISNNTVLNNIDGLSKITEITERLVIENNTMLDNLNGLSNVTRLDGFEGFSLQVKRNPKLSNVCGIIPILTYDPSYVQVYPSINSNSANTSSVQDIIANCNTCNIYEGNLILTSQAQVDTFDYCEITGNLTIQEDVAGDITDLSSLATLEILGGGLYIKSNTSITNLDAFHNLKTINGSLELSKNAILANIDGLSGLEIIKGNLVISINKKITSLSAFNTLTTLNGNLNLLANDGLTDLDGFVNLKQIGGFLEIKGHRSMVSFTGLSNLTTIGTDIRIIGNDLSNLDGLAKLNEIKGNLELTNNFKLSDIHVFANVFSIKELRIKNNNLTDLSGFSGLKDAGAIILNNCDIINLNDLSNLTSLTNRLVLYNNKNLENISGISNAIGKNIIQLEIGGNPNLRSLSGLENLEIISSFVSIFNNQKLKNLDALSNMTKITKNLGIRHNPGLENACGIVQLLENETAVGGLTIIETNGVNTSTVETIIEYCDTNRIFNGDITISTQKDVDTFKYAKIIGNLTIQESSAAAIRNLDGLASLTSVLGNILIKNNVALSTLDGLTSLNTVEGEFVLDTNYTITELGDFRYLRSIGGKLSVMNNQSLKNIDGFSSLRVVYGDIIIRNNKRLTNINGLSSINFPVRSRIYSGIYIDNNQNLINIDGLIGMGIVPGDVSITANPVLKTLDGLSNIYAIQDRLVIRDNTGLEDACGILHLVEGRRYQQPLYPRNSGSEIENNGNIYTSKIAVIESCNKILNGDITLTSQAEVDAFDYNIVKGRLTIAESVSGNITNIDALQTLKEVGSLHIINNRLLENLNGFDNLWKITDNIGDILVLDTNNRLPNDGTDIINEFFCLRIIGGNPIPGPRGQLILVPYGVIGGGEVVKIRSNLSDPFTSITQISPEYPCEPIQPKNVFENRDGKSYARSDENIIIEKLPAQIKSKEKIILYPTIIEGNSVTLSGIKNNFTYSVFSASVQLIDSEEVKSGTQEKTIVFDKQLTSGMYFLRIQEEGGKINTLRFVVK
ncbi:hypothetical protein [Aquimarina algiphila]|uniref:hypothetical protein n=1 Tax=Aquimarina algiphila TaxID=2047982 RepID=UPI00232E87A7|nr:hypothetical protein [Aquimarina algiphila]